MTSSTSTFSSYISRAESLCCRNRGLGCEIDALPYVTGLQAPHVEVQHVYHYNVHQAFSGGGGADDDADEDEDEPFLGGDVCYGFCLPLMGLSVHHVGFSLVTRSLPKSVPPQVEMPAPHILAFTCSVAKMATWSTKERHFCCHLHHVGPLECSKVDMQNCGFGRNFCCLLGWEDWN